MSSAPDLRDSRRFMLTLVLILLGTQAAGYLAVQSVYFAVAVALAVVYVVRRPAEAPWVGFFLLAVTSQLYPTQIDELSNSVHGTYHPYIFVISVIAASLFVGLWFRPGRAYDWRLSQYRGVRRSTAALVAVLFLALAHGYFTSVTTPGLVDVLRECSGWMTFLLFIFLGYRLPASSEETEKAYARLRLSALAYAAFFVVRFINLSSSLGAENAASGYGYSQRDMAYYAGLAFVLAIAQALASEVKWAWSKSLPAGLLLLSAVLFSGSRAVAVCTLVVPLLFLLVWHRKSRLLLGLLGMVAMLIVLFGTSLVFRSRRDFQGGIPGYVSKRFLSLSAQDGSLMDRTSQVMAVAEAVRENPLLGRGPLAPYLFFDTQWGWRETTFLDNGIGYLLMKSGLLGTGIFIWFAVVWLQMAGGLRRAFPGLVVVPLASFVFYLAYLPFGTAFFQFQHSWFIGLLAGQTILLASRSPMVRAAQVPYAPGQPGALA